MVNMYMAGLFEYLYDEMLKRIKTDTYSVALKKDDEMEFLRDEKDNIYTTDLRAHAELVANALKNKSWNEGIDIEVVKNEYQTSN
jgi:hypothetical protein